MAAEATSISLTYGLIVVLAIMLLISLVQLVHANHARKRIASGIPSAPARSIRLVLAAIVLCMLPSYAFDISETALALSSGSATPPPQGSHLALIVCATALGQGFAPALVFLAAFDIVHARMARSAADTADPPSARQKMLTRTTELLLVALLPILIIIHLALYTKAMLDTPTTTANFYHYLRAANTLYRAAVTVHALLLIRLLITGVTFYRRNLKLGERDPIVKSSILLFFVPAEFLRTLALFAFIAISSEYSSATTPVSSSAIRLASVVFLGFTLNVAIQCLLGAAMRPAGQWAPESTDEAAEDTPGDHEGERKRSNSIALSPTKTNFSGVQVDTTTRIDREEPENPFADQ